MDKMLTAKQLSELLQVDLSTVYLWTHAEFIPHYKLRKSVRFREKDISEWLEKRRIHGRRMLKYNLPREI
jgi:excisionase family DNA binding protein